MYTPSDHGETPLVTVAHCRTSVEGCPSPGRKSGRAEVKLKPIEA